MAARKNNLKINHQGLAINADIRTRKLNEQDIIDAPKIIRRDKTGARVTREIYDKATGEPLEEGYGYRFVNTDGEEVPREDIQHYQIIDGREKAFSLYDPTIGGGRTLTPFTWIPIDTIDEYLIDRTYEIWGEDATDIAQLHDLAELIRDYGEAPVIEVILKKSLYKSWGIITPQFFGDTFTMILRITREKIDPDHHMPRLTEEDLEAPAAAEETPKLQQESPFHR